MQRKSFECFHSEEHDECFLHYLNITLIDKTADLDEKSV